MAYDIGIKLKLDGEKEYRDAINNITQVNKTLDAELKAVTSSFTENTSAEEKKAKTEKILQEQLTNSKKKLDEVAKGLADANANYGENSKEVLSWRQAYAKAETDVNNLTKKINDVGKELTETGEKSSTFKDVLKANLTSEAIITGAKALVNAVKRIGEAFVDITKQSRQFADTILTTSAQMSISTDKLQEYEYMSALVDVSVSDLSGSFKKLTSSMNSASKGSGDAYDTFKQLGVSIKDNSGHLRDNEDVFNDVIDALGKIENETERDIIAQSLFGKSATTLNPIIEKGSKALAEYRQEAHDMGFVLDEDALSSLGAVQDNFDRLSNLMKAIVNEIGRYVAPVVKEVTDVFIEWAKSVDWEAVGKVIKTTFKIIGTAITGVIIIATELIEIVAKVVNAITGVVDSIKQFIGNLKTNIEEIKTALKEKFDEIIANAKEWGKNMIEGFIDGIKSKIADIKDKIMPDFMKSIASGINDNTSVVTSALGNLSKSMTLNLNGSSSNSGTSVNINGITFNGYNARTGDEMVRDLNRRLGRLYQ